MTGNKIVVPGADDAILDELKDALLEAFRRSAEHNPNGIKDQNLAALSHEIREVLHEIQQQGSKVPGFTQP